MMPVPPCALSCPCSVAVTPFALWSVRLSFNGYGRGSHAPTSPCPHFVNLTQAAALMNTVYDVINRISDAAAWRSAMVDAALQHEQLLIQQAIEREQAAVAAAAAEKAAKRAARGGAKDSPAGKRPNAISRRLDAVAAAVPAALKPRTVFAKVDGASGATPPGPTLAPGPTVRLQIVNCPRRCDGRAIPLAPAPFLDTRSDLVRCTHTRTRHPTSRVSPARAPPPTFAA